MYNISGLIKRINHTNTVYFENNECGILAKVCKKCEEVKALESFSTHKKGLGGRLATCKTCNAERMRNKRAENPEKYREINRKSRNKNRDKHSERCRRWRSDNVEKVKEYRTNYYEGNIDDILKYNKEYYSKNKKYYAEHNRNWSKNNPDKIAVIGHRRRARKSALPDNFTSEQMNQILADFEGCALTGIKVDIHWDHVIPLTTGHGGTIFGNMIPLKSELNISKHNKNIFIWFEDNKERYNLEQFRFDNLIKYLALQNDMSVEEYREYIFYCHENPCEIVLIDKTS